MNVLETVLIGSTLAIACADRRLAGQNERVSQTHYEGLFDSKQGGRRGCRPLHARVLSPSLGKAKRSLHALAGFGEAS
jgi:hypothetical protein